ncbi:hypothetical protein SAMN05216417_105194 [Nitrosospira multiformis]|uniref:Uncharacterized protein n=1 Tax=Nitrosospira multiformis TaxID=1231 RepID=A0A1I7GR39_9PROT|nr:hypothetical protein SAMN05216417_105194 [Nitrosospira multiformis]
MRGLRKLRNQCLAHGVIVEARPARSHSPERWHLQQPTSPHDITRGGISSLLRFQGAC